MNENECVLVEKRPDGIAVITLNSPPLNLRTIKSIELLERAAIDLDADDTVRVVVITGCKESRAFSAGSDVKEFETLNAMGNMTEVKVRRENAMFTRFEKLKKPVIAALNGLAYGGGGELALACDFRIIDETARICFPEIKLGVFPAGGAPARLSRIVGYSKALELMYTAEPVYAQKCLELGLVNKIAPKGKALETALEFAYLISKRATAPVRALKAITQAAYLQTSDDNVAMSIRYSEPICSSEDAEEGSKSFLEKREPRFAGAPIEFYTGGTK